MRSRTVLLVSTDPTLSAELARQLGDDAHLETVSTARAGELQLSALRPELLVIDARMVSDGGHGLAALLETGTNGSGPLEIVLLSEASCPEPVERRAACGDVVHLRGADCVAALRDLLRNRQRTERTVCGAGIDSPEDSTAPLRRFETRSPALARMLDDLAVAAAHDVTILLIGETGSGKTYLSRLIHESSPRRELPFLHVACGALPRELLESELFGHVKGAFTSAHADKDGKFVAARGGTILLDEIDVLGPEQQVKLLRVIETREFEPVGSNRTLRSQARLVVASNLELQPLVESGRFRPDLYYRLNMLKFDVPPLRQRSVDIVPLARRFVAQFAAQHGVAVQSVEADFYDALARYPWPGNVRELEHVIQRAVIFCRQGVLTPAQLPPHVLLCEAGPANDPSVQLRAVAREAEPSLEAQVSLTERELIVAALARNGHRRTQTAHELGISRVTLYNKMKRYALFGETRDERRASRDAGSERIG